MFGRPRWGVVVWFVAAAAIRPHGTAPYQYANTTTPIASYALAPSRTLWRQSTAASGRPPGITSQAEYPQSTPSSSATASSSSANGTGSNADSTVGSANSTNGSANSTHGTSTASPCTVNIPNASLEWWFAATYSSAYGTLATWAPNFTNDGSHLTAILNTGTFDVTSAISSSVAWTETVVEDPLWGEWTNFEPYSVTPAAAATSLITRNAATPLPSGNIIPASDSLSYLLVTALPPASVPIAGAANATSAVTSATPFLYFTAYEVEYAANGTTTTETVSLAQPSATEYWIKGIEDLAAATGTVPEDFLHQIPQSTCSAGTVQGEVTVLVVLDIYWLHIPPSNPFFVHIESSVDGFEETTDVFIAHETSRGDPFTMAPVDPKWTENLGATTTERPQPTQPGGKTTRKNGPGAPEADNPQPTQGGSGGTTQNGPGQQPSGPAPGNTVTNRLPNVLDPTQTVGTVGTAPVVVAPSSVVMVGTQTVTPGAPAVTFDGTIVSVAPSATAIVIGGATSAIPLVANPGSPTQTVGTVGGMPIVVGPSSVVIVGTATIRPGQPAVTVGGNVVSLAPSATAIIVGDTMSALPQVIFPVEAIPAQAPAPPVLTVGSSTLTANAATQFFIGPGQTLTPGGTATIDGTVVSLGPSASFVVIGGSTQLLPTSFSGPTSQPEIVVGGTTITALPRNPNDRHGNDPWSPGSGDPGPTFIISGQTLSPGHEITIDGTTISLAPSGSFVVLNGVTSTLPNPAAAQITAPPITVGNTVFTAVPGSGTSYIIGSATLTPGGVITVSGTTISLATDGSNVVVNGVTSTLQGQTHATITNPPLLTIGTETYTAADGTGTLFVIGGQTLTPGGVITVDGTTISLAPGATELVYGSAGKSTTAVLFPATTTRASRTTSAPASAGATGGGGEPAATSSATGGGFVLQTPGSGYGSWMATVVVGVVGLLDW